MLLVVLAVSLVPSSVPAQSLADRSWTASQASEILDRTLRIALEPDISALTSGEQAAALKLIQAGHIMHRLYEDSMHPQALTARRMLQDLEQGDSHGQSLLDLYYLFKGPVASTLDNRRVPFLDVRPEEPGKNLYPAGMSRKKMDPLLKAWPELAPGLLDLRSVVRESSSENLQRDLAMLERFPLLDGLHPGLRERLKDLQKGEGRAPVYALPYSVRWAPEIVKIHELLMAASADVASDDIDFSSYLELRARDLLSDNYEGGDAAWVRGRFNHLNAQIGSYEVYGDTLYGVKTFFSFSLLVRDEEKSRELSAALQGLQSVQDSLPLGAGRKIQQEIPVGVYNVVADFGQSRSANTASILPNDADHSRKYGRTILLRYNIMTHPELFESALTRYSTAVSPQFANDLTLEGPFYRTLWHEVGHYLGVDITEDGRDLNEALSPWGSHYEELKADLVSLFTSAQMNRAGQMSDELLRSVQAGGVLRVLQSNQPRIAEQPYQAMQLMQMNYFLEHGLLDFDPATGRLGINYREYEQTVAKMLGEVLAIQSAGDLDRAAGFIQRYTNWTPELHEKLAERLREAAKYRFTMVRYKALM
jgi:hypothetical protein